MRLSKLTGGILRGFKNHKNPEGRLFGAYCRSKSSRYGKLPMDARVVLREAGRCVVDIEWLGRELEAALRNRKLTMARRLRRELRNARFTLEKLETRFEKLAGTSPDQIDVAKQIQTELEREGQE